MPQESLEEQALIEAISDVSPATTLNPGPGPNPSSPKAALRRCCAAWQRAYKAYMENSGGSSTDEVIAAHLGHKAYRNAMPTLSGHDGVRDFIACAAHGILIGAIPENKAGQLLYAAQVALATIQRERKPSESASK